MQPPTIGAQYEGAISISPKGVGYVKIRDLGITVEVPREALNRAFHHDTVKVEVTDLPAQQGLLKSENPV